MEEAEVKVEIYQSDSESESESRYDDDQTSIMISETQCVITTPKLDRCEVDLNEGSSNSSDTTPEDDDLVVKVETDLSCGKIDCLKLILRKI